MRHARPDYNRIQDPAEKIPHDEPVFLLRAQDVAAPETIRFWVGKVLGTAWVTKTRVDDEMIRRALQHANDMEAWHTDRKVKLPDMTRVPVA